MLRDKSFGDICNKDIIEYGLSRKCKACVETIDKSLNFYGKTVGNMGLLFLPQSGIFLTGGITTTFQDKIVNENSFLDGFLTKGRLQPVLKDIPIYLIDDDWIGVNGCRV